MERHRRAAGPDLPHRLHQLFPGHVFEQVTVCARAQGIENQVAIVIGRQHQNLRPRPALLEPRHTLDAAHARQVDVHQHDVGIFRGDVPQRLFGRGCVSEAGFAIAIESDLHRGDTVGFVFDQQYRLRSGFNGMDGFSFRDRRRSG